MNIKNLISNSTNWKQLKSVIDLENNKVKGDVFELLTKLYFQINPEHKSLYDEVWMLSEVPSIVLEHIELPSHDLGIDLIVKAGEEYHAVQCKYHSDKTSNVTFKEVSTFVSLLESTKKLTRGYICSSANDTSKNFQKLKTKPISTLMSDVWQSLDEDFFKQAHALLNGKKVQLVPFEPREHQVKALKEAENYFVKENNSRGKLIFPCGAGKSLTGFWMTQKLKSKSTIIAVPSLSLVKQTLEVYLRETVAHNNKVKWLCICSDEGIGKNDDVVIYTEDLGVPCQTDPEYIEHWLKENINEEIIIFTTYQSGRIIADISKRLKFTFDLGIFDEAHKTVGSNKKLFSHLLFEENISIEKRLFMTATERFYSGSKDDIISMDDEDIYGETFSQMSFKEAIDLGLLTDYKVITIDVKKSEIAEFIKDNKLVQLNDKWKKESEARSLASMLALRKAMKLFGIKNAVSFHSSIEKAVRNKELQQHITDTYDYQPIDAFTVSGKDNTTKRNEIVKEFASSEKALITNAKCLTEGVDVPNIDCIVFADPRKSKVDIVQALGRALRKKEGKEWGYVILPVIYDDTTSEIDNENFTEILNVVRGLASNDNRIVEYFKDKADVNSQSKRKDKEQFNFEVFSDYIDEAELTNQLQIKIWEKLSRFNFLPFEEARAFVQELGIKSTTEWREYCESGNKQVDLHSNPHRAFKNEGWINYGDWLGTGNLSTNSVQYRSFADAKLFTHSLGLKGQKEWREYCKSGNKPNNIPANPQRTYKEYGWKTTMDWLGIKPKEWMPFEDARLFAQNLNLKTSRDWQKYCLSGKKPENIPKVPNATYKDKGWIGIGDWLGTGRKSSYGIKYRNFENAKLFTHSLGFKRVKEWKQYCLSGEKPDDIPSNPSSIYKGKGWEDFGAWLGTNRKATKDIDFRCFEEARLFVHSLGLKGENEWREYCKSEEKPRDIPSAPWSTYINEGWKSRGDWFGTDTISNMDKKFKSFNEAKSFVQSLLLKNQVEWKEYCKSGSKPIDIPSNPNATYKDKGWIGIGDWLGTNVLAAQDRKYRSFEEAIKFARSLKLKGKKEWEEYCKLGIKPNDIPASPRNTYKEKGWIGFADWLGY